MTVVCVGAYGLHLLSPAGRPANNGAAMVAPRLAVPAVSQAGSSTPAGATSASLSQPYVALIYPDRQSADSMHLGYEVFTHAADGSMMALPLPPGTAWHTMLSLAPADHRRLVLAPLQSECAFAVEVNIHRPDSADPAWHGSLPAHSAPAKQSVDLSKLPGSGPLLVSLAMASGASNNWSCNVALSWDDAAVTDTGSDSLNAK